jgi:hypothetical protein
MAPSRIALAALLMCGAASCGSCRKGATQGDASADSSPLTVTPSALSLPIAADHDPSGRVYVAGLVAADHSVGVSLFDATGHLVWAQGALDNLWFSSDAHLDVVAATHGAVVVWRGLRNGKRVRIARWIGDDGKPTTTFDVGSNACTVGDDLFSITGKGGGSIAVRHLPDGAERTVRTLAEGVEPALACGDGKRAYVIEEGEDDLAARPIENGKALSRVMVLSADDLGDDDVREHEDITIGDTLAELVLTEKSRFVLRRVTEAGAEPKRLLDRALGTDEGFMTADADNTHAAVILSRDANSRCDGDVGTDVIAIEVPLGEGPERVIDVVHGDCGKDLGPFWVVPAQGGLYVAWPTRGPRTGVRAPVESLTYTRLSDLVTKSLPLSAEEVVFAGCHHDRCAFAVLARPENTDGMTPGEARVLTIP